MWSFWDASDPSGTHGSQVINVWKHIFFLATFWRSLNLTALWDMHRFWDKFLKNNVIFLVGLLWWNTLSRNKIWYRLYSNIWTKLTVQAPDRTWDEDLLPFKNNIFFPLYVEYVDKIFNPHILHMRIIRIFRIFRIRMANPSPNSLERAPINYIITIPIVIIDTNFIINIIIIIIIIITIIISGIGSII